MKKGLCQAALVLLVLVGTPLLGLPGDRENLENRIRGWVSAVNRHDYGQCLQYVAPSQLTGGRGLTRSIRGGEEFLVFSGGELLPWSDCRITKVSFHNDGFEARVSIDAAVVIQPTVLQMEARGNGEPQMAVFPGSITQRWIRLNGEWFILSQFRIQYVGSP